MHPTAVEALQQQKGLPTVLVFGQAGTGIEELELLLRQLFPTDVPM